MSLSSGTSAPSGPATEMKMPPVAPLPIHASYREDPTSHLTGAALASALQFAAPKTGSHKKSMS